MTDVDVIHARLRGALAAVLLAIAMPAVPAAPLGGAAPLSPQPADGDLAASLSVTYSRCRGGADRQACHSTGIHPRGDRERSRG